MTRALDHLRAADPVIADLIDHYPRPKQRRGRDPYHDLLHAVLSQQVSVRAADAISRRFLDLFPDRTPAPDRLAAMSDAELRTAGVSRQKAGYLRAIAAFTRDGGLDRDRLRGMTDDAIIDHLVQIRGVGRWTAEMLLMFTLNRPDILPVDDLGIRNAMTRLYRLRSKGPRLTARMITLARPWRPHRTLACRYLWLAGDTTPDV